MNARRRVFCLFWDVFRAVLRLAGGADLAEKLSFKKGMDQEEYLALKDVKDALCGLCVGAGFSSFQAALAKEYEEEKTGAKPAAEKGNTVKGNKTKNTPDVDGEDDALPPAKTSAREETACTQAMEVDANTQPDGVPMEVEEPTDRRSKGKGKAAASTKRKSTAAADSGARKTTDSKVDGDKGQTASAKPKGKSTTEKGDKKKTPKAKPKADTGGSFDDFKAATLAVIPDMGEKWSLVRDAAIFSLQVCVCVCVCERERERGREREREHVCMCVCVCVHVCVCVCVCVVVVACHLILVRSPLVVSVPEEHQSCG